jgi:ATP-dependent Lon protease
MKESAKAALTCGCSRLDRLGISQERLREGGVHVQVPVLRHQARRPSVGVTIATALASLYSGHPVKADIAMTGEITISGLVLPVGGLKEKLLAARRAGVRHVILPHDNQKDLRDLDESILRELRVAYVERVEQVWALAIPQLASRLAGLGAHFSRRRVPTTTPPLTGVTPRAAPRPPS